MKDIILYSRGIGRDPITSSAFSKNGGGTCKESGRKRSGPGSRA